MWHHGSIILILVLTPVIISVEKQSNRVDSSPPTQSAQNPGCPACMLREQTRARTLITIKESILKKMGFASAPNVTGRPIPKIPPHILAKVDQGMQNDEPQFKPGLMYSEEEDDFHAKTEIVFSYAQPYPRLRHNLWGHDILHFPLSDGILKYYVANATLNVYVLGVDKRPQPNFYLDFYKVYKNQKYPDTPNTVKIFTKRIVQPLGPGNWIQIDITELISEWFKNPNENYGFILNGTVGGRKVIVTDDSVDEGGKVPFAEIVTVGAKRRTRRNLAFNCDDTTDEKICCRYPVTVNFEELELDFIISPKSYEAFYCSGECPYVTLQSYPHTHLVQMVSPNLSGPCCVPRKMSSISMLYVDNDGNVIYSNFPGMVVDRCGCI